MSWRHPCHHQSHHACYFCNWPQKRTTSSVQSAARSVSVESLVGSVNATCLCIIRMILLMPAVSGSRKTKQNNACCGLEEGKTKQKNACCGLEEGKTKQNHACCVRTQLRDRLWYRWQASSSCQSRKFNSQKSSLHWISNLRNVWGQRKRIQEMFKVLLGPLTAVHQCISRLNCMHALMQSLC